ncbi:MAG TPA: hypothetical protein DD426_09840 [Clostridiaceae bacterium]|nr:hypothetical protein [Clostridiaceae bacterium]
MQNIKSEVRKLINLYQTSDPFALCKALNILIIKIDLGSIRGIYQYKNRKQIIYLNCNLHSTLSRQVCAHELGHAILHKKTNTIFLDTYT